jgi:hypothetical protein
MLHQGCGSVVCGYGHCTQACRRYYDVTIKAAAMDLEIKVGQARGQSDANSDIYGTMNETRAFARSPPGRTEPQLRRSGAARQAMGDGVGILLGQ